MLDHHKRKKNLFKNRKAFSSIVGAIFAILVIVTLTGTFFVWSLEQNSRYVNAVSDVNQLALDQQNESLNVTSVPVYTVDSGGAITASLSVQNDGPITIQLASLWIQDLNGSQPYGYTVLPNVILSPGQSWSTPPTVQVTGATLGDSFAGWLISARGNVFPLIVGHLKGDAGQQGTNGADGSQWIVGTSTPPPSGDGRIGDFYLNTQTYVVYRKTSQTMWTEVGTLKGPPGIQGQQGIPGADFNATGDIKLFNGTTSTRNAQVAQGIGSIMLDFKSFRAYPVVLYNKQTATGVINLNLNTSVYAVSNSIPYIFSVNVTNVDNTNKSIILTSSSSFWMTNPPPNNGPLTCAYWAIANLTGAGSTKSVRNLATTEFVELPWDVPTTLYFGPMLPTTGALATGTAAATNMLLIGSILTSPAIDYGQNLPFIALNVVA